MFCIRGYNSQIIRPAPNQHIIVVSDQGSLEEVTGETSPLMNNDECFYLSAKFFEHQECPIRESYRG